MACRTILGAARACARARRGASSHLPAAVGAAEPQLARLLPLLPCGTHAQHTTHTHTHTHTHMRPCRNARRRARVPSRPARRRPSRQPRGARLPTHPPTHSPTYLLIKISNWRNPPARRAHIYLPIHPSTHPSIPSIDRCVCVCVCVQRACLRTDSRVPMPVGVSTPT